MPARDSHADTAADWPAIPDFGLSALFVHQVPSAPWSSPRTLEVMLNMMPESDQLDHISMVGAERHANTDWWSACHWRLAPKRLISAELFSFGRIGERTAFRDVGISRTLKVDLGVMRKPMIAVIVEDQARSQSPWQTWCRTRHRRWSAAWREHPSIRPQYTAPNNQQSPLASIKGGILRSNQVQLLRIHSG